MVTDPIADMFTSLRNAALVGKEEVVVPYSGFGSRVAKVLQEEGFLLEVRKFKGQKDSRFFLSLKGLKLKHLKRLSKPGQRWYVSWRKFENPPLGVKIVSTSKGVMTHLKARKRRLGGELLGEIW